MFRVLISALLVLAAVGFAPTMKMEPKVKSLALSRRDAIVKGAAFLGSTAFLSAPKSSSAGSLEVNNPIPDNEYVPSQQARSDKIDINSAFVGDYKKFSGFFPHAAGMIASNGPYNKVSDIYNIPGITENDKKLFKQYEKELIALPAMYRQFNERINGRVST